MPILAELRELVQHGPLVSYPVATGKGYVMDIGRAFSFVFDDANWVKKILIGGLISLLAIVLPVLGLLASFVVYGYALEVIRRVYLDDPNPLPEWDDIGGYLVRGLLLSVGTFLWLAPPMVLVGCVGGGIIVLGSASDDDALAVFSGFLAFGIIGLAVLLIIVWSVVFLPIISGRYAVERRFGTMFEFGAIFAEIRRAGAGPLLVLLLTVIVAGFVSNLGIVACFIGVVFTSFYSYLVMAHGAGQVYRRARGFDAGPISAGQAF